MVAVESVSRLDEIEASLNEVAGHLNAQHGRLVALAAELLGDDTWFGDGIHTPEQYLSWRSGLSPSRAREIVTVARAAGTFPECVAALGRGELSLDQVVAIVKRAPWWLDTEMLDLARELTVTQLRRVLARYPFPDAPRPGDEAADDVTADEPVDEGRERTDFFWSGECADGRWELTMETDTLTGSIIDRALDEARDALFHGGQHDVTMIDAMREVCERSLDSIDSPQRRDRYRVHVHLDTDATATDALGWRLPDEVRRQLSCDGLCTSVHVADGIPLSVGRTQRIVPERTRRIVIHRDQGCRIPGCTVTHHLEVHHIVHWEDHGPTDTWNLIALCPHHHRLHHQGKLGISGNADDPDGVTFTYGDGRRLTTSGARPEPPGAPPSPPIGSFHTPWGERLDMRQLGFRPPPGQRWADPYHRMN